MAVAGAQAERRGGTSQGSAGAEPSGAAGRCARARGAPRIAAVQGAERSRPADAVQGAERSPPGLSPAQPASGGAARFPYQFSPSAGLLYWPTLPAHPSRSTKKKKATNSESWKNVQRQRARSLRVGNDRFLQVRLGFTGGVVGTGCWRAGLPFPPHARGTAPRQSLSR